MRSSIGRITIKFVEVLGCLASFMTKIITDLEARRVFVLNQKLSREWGLLHNITWSSAGNSFANITYGGFTLITTLMLISRCIDAKSRPSMTEKIFLTVGMLCFFIMGSIVLAAFDQVPSELHDNSLILGGISFFVGFIMLLDLADPMARLVADTTQTDDNFLQSHQSEANNHQLSNRGNDNHIDTSQHAQLQKPQSSDNHVSPDINNHVAIEPRRPNQKDPVETASKTDIDEITRNGNYHRSDSFDFVQMQQLPQVQQPVFEQVLMPEKKRPAIQKISDPSVNVIHREIVQSQPQTAAATHRQYSRYDDSNRYDDDHEQRYDGYGQTVTNYSIKEKINNNNNNNNNYHQHHHQRSSTNRYRDGEDGGPMMVIRDYSRVIACPPYQTPNENHPYATAVTSSTPHSARGSIEQNNNYNRKVPQHHNHKQANPIRPGFVANAAKIWNRRAAHHQRQHSNELNTIV